MRVSIAVAALTVAVAQPLAAQERPSVAPQNMQQIAPGLADYTDDVLYGDVWVRPQLSPRDRSLVTLSALIAAGKMAQVGGHLNRGLTNGLNPSEIAGLVTHLAFYTGWPNAVSALNVIEQTFAERKIDASALRTAQAAGSVAPPPPLSDSAAGAVPKLGQLTNDVIRADLWRRTDLTARDRSLVTIAALAANGDEGSLEQHIRHGVANGLTKAEIGEAITHIAFYAGWPRSEAAAALAAQAFGDAGPPPAGAQLEVVPPGLSPTQAAASNFTGTATVTSRFKGTGEARLGGATVSFRAGAHTNWHSHPLGQLLIITAGQGWVQADGEPVRLVSPGDVIWTGPGVKHWHGATRTTPMTHVAVAEAMEGASVTWLEPVTREEYRGPLRSR